MGRQLAPRQEALYQAEAESIDALGIRWRRIADAQRAVDTLVGSDWFGELWPHFVRATVERRGRGAAWSTCVPLDSDGPDGRPTEGVILVAGALRQPVVLHELAHLLLPRDVGHGPAFAETMLTIVRHEMGFVAFAEYLYALRRREPFRTVRERIA
jgi:putative metallohydrolase (TIGR04338 family)